MDDRTPVILLEEIFPGDTNPYGTAFGGKILALIDRAAGLAASRYAHQHFVTASLDVIAFRAPVRQGEVAEVKARVVYTSRRTCGVRVEVSALDKTSWDRRSCCHGLVFMVAMGADGEPLPVPAFEPESETERQEWAEAAEAHLRARGRPRR
jgi:acyl-CoA hydrolase